MSDIKLFHRTGASLSELPGSSSPLEKALQTLFEQNLETMLGVRCQSRSKKGPNRGVKLGQSV